MRTPWCWPVDTVRGLAALLALCVENLLTKWLFQHQMRHFIGNLKKFEKILVSISAFVALSNFTLISWFKLSITWLSDFSKAYNKTSLTLFISLPVFAKNDPRWSVFSPHWGPIMWISTVVIINIYQFCPWRPICLNTRLFSEMRCPTDHQKSM